LTAVLNSFAERINRRQPRADAQARASDVLSGLAPLLRVQRVEVEEICRFALNWKAAHEPQAAGWAQFHIVTKGRCRVEVQGQSLGLQTGSILLIPGGDAHTLGSARRRVRPQAPIRLERGGPVNFKTNTEGSGDTELICGRLQFDAISSGLAAAALPAVVVVNVHVQRALGDMRALVRMVDEELKSARPGALAIASDLSSALFVLMLRAHLEQDSSSGALLRLLGSAACAKSVHAMVSQPARGWSLDELAKISNVSRATLVRAFQKAAQRPPLAFLAELRLNLARRSLANSKRSVSQVSTAAGYASESAFVRAFSRRFGVSPGKLRKT
jgi:AraC family transcriptional activator of mtrCDE